MRNIFKLTVWGMLILLVVCQLSAQTSLEVVDDEIDAMTVLQVADKVTISYIDVDAKGSPVQRSNIFTIRPDGTIFHELLGAVALANITIAEAEEVLTEKFSQSFNQPRVALSVLEKTSIKVILYGEVSRVGVFPIKPNTRVAEFIIENGGTTPEADLARITVSRADGGKVVFDMEKYLFTSEPVNNVILKDKDKIIVPRFKVQEKYGRLSKKLCAAIW